MYFLYLLELIIIIFHNKMSKTGKQSYDEVDTQNGAKNLKMKTDEELNNIAISIVKNIKDVIENIFLKNMEEAHTYLCKNYNILPSLSIKEKSYSLDMFNNNKLFYEQLEKYSNTYIGYLTNSKYNISDIKKNFNNSFSITNFSILTDLLIKILETYKKAYKEDIIKTDISIIIETITSKISRITNSNSLFMCFVNELKMKYEIKIENENSFIKEMDKQFRKKSQENLESIKERMIGHITDITNNMILKYQDKIDDIKDDDPNLDKILSKKRIISRFYNDIKNNWKIYRDDLINLKNKCMGKELYSLFEEYSQIMIDENNDYKTCTKEYLLDYIILPFKILDIDLSKDEEMKIVYNIPDDFGFLPKSKYYNTFLGKYMEFKNEIKYVSETNYEKDIKELINDNKFIDEIFRIISSKSVSSYLRAKIKFLNDYNVEFVEEGSYDVFLKNQYDEFMTDMKKDFKKFRDLIIIKQICYKIPAMTDSSMRIYINPIYEISENLKKDSNQIKSVLKSALIILLVHEIAHFLKAYSSQKTLKKNYPVTPNKKENGRCLIFYLFNIGVIKSINYKQSCLINDISIWGNLNDLRKIFEKVEETSDGYDGELDFYLANSDEEAEIEQRNEYCIW